MEGTSQTKLCSYSLTKIKLSPFDDFFEEGNLACFQGPKQMINEIDELADEFVATSVSLIPCSEKGCNQTFSSRKAYEYHYIAFHKYRCSTCKSNFPSNYLLELHILEHHDPMFETQLQRGLVFYKCTCDGCEAQFKERKDRNDHVIKEHNYPADFRFFKLKPKVKQKKDMEIDPILQDAAFEDKEMPDQVHSKCEFSNDASSTKLLSFKKTAPKNICFGRGSERGFQRTRRAKVNSCHDKPMDLSSELNTKR